MFSKFFVTGMCHVDDVQSTRMMPGPVVSSEIGDFPIAVMFTFIIRTLFF